MIGSPKRFVITSAPPNPNGDLHLGHLAGPFLGADVLSRFLRQQGHQVNYVGYCDDFSCYVPRRAAELGLGVHETAHVFGQRMTQTLTLASMPHDYFTHPLREPVHAETVEFFFRTLWESGAFEVAEFPVLWCPGCSRYLYEAEMRGRCQFCAAGSDGFYCEECGLPQESAGLADAFCTNCKSAPQLRRLRRIAFPLDKYRERLREYYDGRPMRPRLRAYLDDILSRPLPLTPVSRHANYGIPVPIEGWEGHILDTWYSGIWGYLAATKAHASALGDPDGLAAWSDPETQIYEFIGFDCSFSHAVLWPALFLAHGKLNLPAQIVTNEFYRLEGDKFSTSRGHAIWGREFLRQVPADQLRFYLCLTGPERTQTNFLAIHFRDTVNSLIAGRLKSWLERVIWLVNEDFEGLAPSAEPTPTWRKSAKALSERIAATLEPDWFSPQEGAKSLAEAIEFAAAAMPELDELRATDPGGYDAALAGHLEFAAIFAAVASPIMPSFAEQVWSALGLEFADPVRRTLPWPDGSQRMVGPGQRIAKALPVAIQDVAI